MGSGWDREDHEDEGTQANKHSDGVKVGEKQARGGRVAHST